MRERELAEALLHDHVYDRIFSTSIGINRATVISASFDLLFFYAFGLLTTAALGGSRNIWWAVRSTNEIRQDYDDALTDVAKALIELERATGVEQRVNFQ
jgi:hypothetical protein